LKDKLRPSLSLLKKGLSVNKNILFADVPSLIKGGAGRIQNILIDKSCGF